MKLKEAKEIFNKLYENVNGRTLSLDGRDKNALTSKSFVYGEVVPDSFHEVILETNPQPGYIFYDLGSGTGKAVFLAYLLFEFAESKGIELLDTLADAAEEVLKRFETEIRPTIANELGNRKISLIKGDILQTDFTDADLIFINSTCFQDDLMEELEKKLEKVRPHTQVVTLSKGIKSPYFYLYKHKLYEFSWGQATAFFHRKRLWKVYDE